MIQIAIEDIGPQLKTLIETANMPAILRQSAVLDRKALGQVFTDDARQPTWGIVREAMFGTLYLSGKPCPEVIQELIAKYRNENSILIGLWPGDPYLELLPLEPDYDGRVLEFFDRPIGTGLDPFLKVPDGCDVRRMDLDLFLRSEDRDLILSIYGSAEEALAQGIGFGLMRGDEMVSEAFAAPAARGMIEMGVVTHEDHRRRGYGTTICAHTIHACESMGYETYWNCSKRNEASANLARKLGYCTWMEYRLLGWLKLE
jgi:GNAT superfamily N-acetyltransferase